MLAIGGRQAADEQRGIGGQPQIVLGNEGSVGNIDGTAGINADLGKAAGDIGKHDVIDRLVGGIAILELGENGDLAAGAQQRDGNWSRSSRWSLL